MDYFSAGDGEDGVVSVGDGVVVLGVFWDGHFDGVVMRLCVLESVKAHYL